MATNRIIPPAHEQIMPEEAPDRRPTERDLDKQEARKLNNVLHAGAVAQITVGVAVVLTICYVAKLVLITLLVSVLLAFMAAVKIIYDHVNSLRPIGEWMGE